MILSANSGLFHNAVAIFSASVVVINSLTMTVIFPLSVVLLQSGLSALIKFNLFIITPYIKTVFPITRTL